MKTKIIALSLMVAALLTAVACKKEAASENLGTSKGKIISMSPAHTEILIALGYGDKIIAIDDFSSNIAGIKSGIPMFNMMTPDGEQIINLQPDIIFATEMSKAGGAEPFKVVADAGIRIIYIQSSSSINGIKKDIRHIANVMGAESKGEGIILDMEKEINDIKKIGDSITYKKSVYFEISAAPNMYSFGKGTFLNEMIELIGATNILENQESWLSITDEAILDANPDIILTSVDYIKNPADEIKLRPGWDKITAVKNNAVYYINSDASNRPSHNIVKALKEMAKAVYPDKY